MSTPWTRPQKIAVWSGFVVALGVVGALGTLAYEIHKFGVVESERAEEERKKKVREWQEVIVYNILQQRMNKERGAMTFEEIRTEYVTQATAVQGIDLKREELQELPLKKILLVLMSLGLVYEMAGGKYAIQQSVLNVKFDRVYPKSDAADKILFFVDNESGKHTIDEIDAKLRDELKLSKEEFTRILVELSSLGYIILHEDGKLYSKLKPPKK